METPERPPVQLVRDATASMIGVRTWARGVREWLRANAHAAHVHHMQETQRLIRMAAAKGVGVDPVHFDVPFPGTTDNSTSEVHYHMENKPAQSIPIPTPQAPAKASIWPTIALIAASILGTGGLAGGLIALLMTRQPPPAPAPAQDPGVDYYYQNQKDGPWQRVPVVPVPPG